MNDSRTDSCFTEELPRLLREHQTSIRSLARQVGVTDAHLSRVLRGVNYKRVSAELARRVALAFKLAEDYFPEAREGYVIDAVRRDPALRDELYDRLRSISRG